MPSLRKTILPGVLSFLLVTAVPAAHAQRPTIHSTNADEQAIVRLKHTHHPLAKEENAAGRVEGSRALRRMLLVLTPGEAKEQELKNLLEEQQDRGSANYHHWLTAAEFGARFGATDEDVQEVRVWLERAGFSVERVAGSKRWLEFSGFSLDRALGWGWEDALHSEDRPRFVEAWRASIASGIATIFPLRRFGET